MLFRSLTITNPNMTRFMMTLSDAVDLVLYAFEHGDLELLEKCLHDKIHQPYRFPIIDDSLIFLDYARENKLPFVISGAGPTLLLLSKEKPIIKVKTKHNWQYLNLKVCKEGSVSYE